MENGNRAENIGLNPHSKEDIFSRLIDDFLDKISSKEINNEQIIIIKNNIINRFIIIYIMRINFLIGSQLY